MHTCDLRTALKAGGFLWVSLMSDQTFIYNLPYSGIPVHLAGASRQFSPQIAPEFRYQLSVDSRYTARRAAFPPSGSGAG